MVTVNQLFALKLGSLALCYFELKARHLKLAARHVSVKLGDH